MNGKPPLVLKTLLLAAPLALLLTSAATAKVPPVAVGDMDLYCQGEASAKFGVRPQDIMTQPPSEHKNGAHSVFGQFPTEGSKVTTFECRFSPSNHFHFVKKTGGKHKHKPKKHGSGYDATGMIPCSMGGGQPTGQCSIGVHRDGGGTGVVTVTKPDGRTRAIFFEDGQAVGFDFSQADAADFRASKQSDLNIVHIGEERYEIPDAVIYGG